MTSPTRRNGFALALCAGALLALPGAADAGSRARPGFGGARPSGLGGSSALVRSPSTLARAHRDRSSGLARFTDQRRREARRRVWSQGRDAERHSEEASLRRHGTRADLEAYRRRARQEEDRESLRQRIELDRRLAFDDGVPKPGPVTRRVLERSGIELRRLQRRHDLERDLRALEDEIAARERSQQRQGRWGWLPFLRR